MITRQPQRSSDDPLTYRNLGNRAVSPMHSVGLDCHHCKVTWNGCAAECCCPECGAPKDYTGDGRCLCEKCIPRGPMGCEKCGNKDPELLFVVTAWRGPRDFPPNGGHVIVGDKCGVCGYTWTKR